MGADKDLRYHGWDVRIRRSVLPRTPRSSKGKTAAFGAVNRGSNPCRGAKSQAVILLMSLLIERTGSFLGSSRSIRANFQFARDTPKCVLILDVSVSRARLLGTQSGNVAPLVMHRPEFRRLPRNSGPALAARGKSHFAQRIIVLNVGHRSAQASHLGNLAFEQKRRVKFDPISERVLPA